MGKSGLKKKWAKRRYKLKKEKLTKEEIGYLKLKWAIIIIYYYKNSKML